MQRDARRRLEELAVNRRHDTNIIVRARRRAANAVLLVDELHELPQNQRHATNPLHLLLCTQELAFQITLLVLNVALLDLQELKMALEILPALVQVGLLGVPHDKIRIILLDGKVADNLWLYLWQPRQRNAY